MGLKREPKGKQRAPILSVDGASQRVRRLRHGQEFPPAQSRAGVLSISQTRLSRAGLGRLHQMDKQKTSALLWAMWSVSQFLNSAVAVK